MKDQESLVRQIESIDFEELVSIQSNGAEPVGSLTDVKDPLTYKYSTLDTSASTNILKISSQEAVQAGLEVLRRGKVGAVVVAGGLGTRLGFPSPKGMFPMGPVSGMSLFQMHCEKIAALSKRYGYRIPYCMMTSHATHEQTVLFLQQNNYFGLHKEDVFLFMQDSIPICSKETGKILLSEKGCMTKNPNGHGGMMDAISRKVGNHSVLDRLCDRGIEYLFYHQVDNPLTQICTPEFLGSHILSGSEMTSQVIRKQEPSERLGGMFAVGGRLHAIEYCNLPATMAPHIWAGSIAVHLFNMNFLERMSQKKLPYHAVLRTHSFIDPVTEQKHCPSENNAIQYERFILDMVLHAEQALVVEVPRQYHYAPLKNAHGLINTPAWCQKAMSDLHRHWLERAGLMVKPGMKVEIAPQFADSAETLMQNIRMRSAETVIPIVLQD